MTIRGLASSLGLEMIQESFVDRQIEGAYTSDLLSDVMANAGSDFVLITIQAHKNTVAVASLLGLAAIILCNAKPIPQDMIDAARDEGVALLRSKESQFQISGRLWTASGGDALRAAVFGAGGSNP
jgi:serine kinase of HPr protein (carbohydrate metabolism regulator)